MYEHHIEVVRHINADKAQEALDRLTSEGYEILQVGQFHTQVWIICRRPLPIEDQLFPKAEVVSEDEPIEDFVESLGEPVAA